MKDQRNAHRSRWPAIVVTGLLATLAACSSPDDWRPGPVVADESSETSEAAPEHAAAPVIGVWMTDPQIGQLGVTIVHFEFRADETFAGEVELRSMNLPKPMRSTGTYRIEGDTIIMRGQQRTTRATFHFDGDDLVFTERDGDAFVLKRQ